MHFSKKSQYGLRAAVALAQRDSTDYVSIGTLSHDLDIPVQYLRKILRILTQHDVTESCRGPSGGIRLRSSPDEITIRRLIELFEGKEVFDLCPMGFSGCNGPQQCVLGANCPNAKVRTRTEVPLRQWANELSAEVV